MRKKSSARSYKKIIAAEIILVILLMCGCNFINGTEAIQAVPESITVEKEPVPDINDVTVREDKSVYQNDEDGSLVTMYLTVRRGNSADNTDHSWAEINQYSVYDYVKMGVERYGVEAILQVGNENGPLAGELGYSAIVPNAVVNVRGATTSRTPQKSYKIKLKENAGSWRDQNTIALNKHVYDYTRIRNKLSYDYIKQINNMIGLRTQFVHLYVKDETNDAPNAKFEDYGLFTQVEQPNTRFLKNHGLDSGGQFYKATFFEFERYEGELALTTDSFYDDTEFNNILEVKGDTDHTKLIEMLDHLNDYGRSIEEVLETYFDADNYFTWLAFNILSGNIDTQTQNFYLFSPTNSKTWYFIPWDYDGAWARYIDEKIDGIDDIGFESGISNYWGGVLHRRVLSLPKYRQLLNEKILELYAFMTPERTKAMLDIYRPIAFKYAFSMPDRMYLSVTEAQWNAICDQLPYEVERNYQLYLESLQKPMPFYLGVPEQTKDNRLRFLWEAAYDLDSEDVTYDLEVSDSYLFESHIYDEHNLTVPIVTLGMLPPGQYFIRVTAENESGYRQCAIDYYVDTHSQKHFGIKCFYVLDDGTVVQGEGIEKK